MKKFIRNSVSYTVWRVIRLKSSKKTAKSLKNLMNFAVCQLLQCRHSHRNGLRIRFSGICGRGAAAGLRTGTGAAGQGFVHHFSAIWRQQGFFSGGSKKCTGRVNARAKKMPGVPARLFSRKGFYMREESHHEFFTIRSLEGAPSGKFKKILKNF